MLINIIASFFIISNPLLVLTSQVVFNQQPQTASVVAANPINITALAESDGVAETEDKDQPTDSGLIQAQLNPDYLPIRNWSKADPVIDAKAAIIYDTYKDKILWKYNIDEVLPIASISKLMTAIIVLENADLDNVVSVSLKAYQAPGFMGNLRAYEKLSVRKLLYIMLMESSNDAAEALAESLGRDHFISLMNNKAQELGMSHTGFLDPYGISPSNLSTVGDLVILAKAAFKYPLIWKILSTQQITLQSNDGKFDHHLLNNDILLKKVKGVVGGKTGYTEEANGCMLLVTDELSKEKLITVVLGSNERMQATEKLINWAQEAFLWH